MKRLFQSIFAGSVVLLALAACSGDDESDTKKDTTMPVIESDENALPSNCQVYYKGEVIPFRCLMSDNQELGNYNIEIHHNFDHHTHSTDAGECELDAKKTPVHPWVYNQSFTIPQGSSTYDAQVDIPIPNDIDPGDYHFMIRLTDKAGWQQLRAVSIKIKEKAN